MGRRCQAADSRLECHAAPTSRLMTTTGKKRREAASIAGRCQTPANVCPTHCTCYAGGKWLQDRPVTCLLPLCCRNSRVLWHNIGAMLGLGAWGFACACHMLCQPMQDSQGNSLLHAVHDPAQREQHCGLDGVHPVEGGGAPPQPVRAQPAGKASLCNAHSNSCGCLRQKVVGVQLSQSGKGLSA